MNSLNQSDRRSPRLAGGVLYVVIAVAAAVCAEADALAQQGPNSLPIAITPASPREEAWWTGPVSTSSANTLKPGHVLIEPYIFNARSAGGDYLGSLTYLLYGVTDDFTVGAIPTFGGSSLKAAGRARRIGVNDLTLTAQLRLRRARSGERLPAVSVVVQHSLPLGRFDRLGATPERGIGSGAHATLVGVYAERTSFLANGRPLRTRVNITKSIAWRTRVHGSSVFGTPSGFAGTARPGTTSVADVSIEYSISRSWVVAADLVGRLGGKGRVDGGVANGSLRWSATIPETASASVSPAIEYSWSSSRGVLLGARIAPAGRGTTATVTPVVAFNAIF